MLMAEVFWFSRRYINKYWRNGQLSGIRGIVMYIARLAYRANCTVCVIVTRNLN